MRSLAIFTSKDKFKIGLEDTKLCVAPKFSKALKDSVYIAMTQSTQITTCPRHEKKDIIKHPKP